MTEGEVPHPRRNLLTPQETADRLGVSARTLHRYEARGLIKAQKTPAGHRRYDPDEVQRLVDADATDEHVVADQSAATA